MKKNQAILLLFCFLFLTHEVHAQQLKVYDKNGNPEKIVGEKSIIEIEKNEPTIQMNPSGIVGDILLTGIQGGYEWLVKSLKDSKLKYTSNFSASKYFTKGYDFKDDIIFKRKVLNFENEEDSIFILRLVPIKTDETKNGFKITYIEVNKSIAKIKKDYAYNDYKIHIKVSAIGDDGKMVEKELPELYIPLFKVGTKMNLSLETIPIMSKSINSIQISITEINAYKQKSIKKAELLEANEQRLNDLFQKLLKELKLKE